MSDSIADVLGTVPLLSGLDKKQLRAHGQGLQGATVPAGTAIIRQGDDHGMGFFVVSEGEAVVTVDGAEVSRVSGRAATSARSPSSATGSEQRRSPPQRT